MTTIDRNVWTAERGIWESKVWLHHIGTPFWKKVLELQHLLPTDIFDIFILIKDTAGEKW